jgi:hypothetical protein
VRVTDAIRYILATKGIFILNYIDDRIGIAPDSVADSHFQITINLLSSLGSVLSNSKTVAPTYVATCLGIVFHISNGVLKIPKSKLEETIFLCKFHYFKKFITQNQLQVLIGHLMFLHKAVKPAREFVNQILALLRNMGTATKVAIDEGTKRDLQWFMACARAVNGTTTIYKCMLPRIDIFVDASLSGLGGVLHNYVYELAIAVKPGYSIAHWEAINVLVALRIFSPFLHAHNVTVWCDNTVAVSILSSGRGTDPILQSIARNIWLFQASVDCNLSFAHVKGKLNNIADLLSRWSLASNPVAKLYFLLNDVPIWFSPPLDVLDLDHNI